MPPPEPGAAVRVNFVIHSFDRGGSGRVAAYLARGFAELGMTVAMTVLARGGDAEDVATGLLGNHVKLRYLGQTGALRPLDLLRALPRLAALLRREPADAVIACANNSALVTAIAFRLARARGFLFLKTTNPIASSRHRGVVRRLRRASYSWIFRWTRGVWTLSAQESEEMRAAFPRHETLFRDVANPYVTEAMLAQAVELKPPTPGKIVICVARLSPQKRLERLVAAFALVRTPDTRLLILGEGEERVQLEAQVRQLGIADRVSLPGFTNDVASALHAADLFVLSSDYEGLPAVVLEAMAANCPVISTDCFPAARALLSRSEACAIIEQTDPVHLAAQIDEHLGRARPARLREVAERYSIGNGIASHADALLDAL